MTAPVPSLRAWRQTLTPSLARRGGGKFQILVGLALSCVAVPASAQFGGSFSIQSDDQFRGRSLSEGRPVATLDISYDSPTGIYLSAAATAVATRHSGLKMMGYQENIGFARKVKWDAVVDIGVANSSYTEYFSGGYSADYTEIYAGLIVHNISAHIHYSPNYFHRNVSTIYADIDGAVRLAPKWRLNGHLGLLTQTSGPLAQSARRTHYDWRLAITRQVGRLDLQLAWTGGGPDSDYYANRERGHNALTFAITYAF